MRDTPSALGLRGRVGVIHACLLLWTCLSAGGCNVAAFVGYIFAPRDDEPKTVQAKYKGLEGRSLAIVVFTDPSTQYEYPTAREHVAGAIATEFAKEEVHKEIKNFRVVPVRNVLSYQERNLRWNELDKTQLAKNLGADSLLFVSLTEFTTREPHSTGMMRGIVTAEVTLYDARKPESASRVWKGDNVRVVYPDDSSPGVIGTEDRAIRQTIVSRLAQKIAWNFYKHQETPDPHETSKQ
jgi:hypothetical protein